MKVKDGLFSLAVGYIVTTLPIWEERNCIWLIGLMAAVICWDAIIRVEELWKKKKSARGAATPDRARLKINFK